MPSRPSSSLRWKYNSGAAIDDKESGRHSFARRNGPMVCHARAQPARIEWSQLEDADGQGRQAALPCGGGTECIARPQDKPTTSCTELLWPDRRSRAAKRVGPGDLAWRRGDVGDGTPHGLKMHTRSSVRVTRPTSRRRGGQLSSRKRCPEKSGSREWKMLLQQSSRENHRRPSLQMLKRVLRCARSLSELQLKWGRQASIGY